MQRALARSKNFVLDQARELGQKRDTYTFRTIDTTHTAAMVAKKGIRIWTFSCILTLWHSIAECLQGEFFMLYIEKFT